MLNASQVTSLATHALELMIGVGAILGLVLLTRGRRAEFGLVLMAAAMAVVVRKPRVQLGMVGIGAYVARFLGGLWLLLGPGSPGPGGPAAPRG
ncbi:hypothetical protein HNR00_003322 [Methylorubrum rhodinum]|jgi:hypothetical protein|uniref:Uncharacterized protein n=2 Tax=Methylorubrum TaxID=2282523 RepID=A0A840ZKQ7_9HYPH|nr:hypothetical protein [Methylorubrum rhodinum]MBB5758599.1 hypothetical protein [Methylorubrum rhodinum]